MKSMKNNLCMMMVLALTLCPVLAGAEEELTQVDPVALEQVMEQGGEIEIIDDQVPLAASNTCSFGAAPAAIAVNPTEGEPVEGEYPELAPEDEEETAEVAPEDEQGEAAAQDETESDEAVVPADDEDATVNEEIEEPTEEEIEQPAIERSVTVERDMPAIIRDGDAFFVNATLVGFEQDEYSLSWEYNDGNGWQRYEGGNGTTLEVKCDGANVDYSWRVVVEVVVAKESVDAQPEAMIEA